MSSPHKPELVDCRSIDEIEADSQIFNGFGFQLSIPDRVAQEAAVLVIGSVDTVRANHLGNTLMSQLINRSPKKQRQIQIAAFVNLAKISVERKVEEPELGNEVYDLLTAQSSADYLRSQGWRYKKAANQIQRLIDAEISIATIVATETWHDQELQ